MKFPKFRFAFGGLKKPRLRSACGLDIGSHSVKWVEIRDSGKLELATWSVVPIKKDKSRESVIAAVKDALQTSGSVSRRVCSAIGGQSVIARYIDFPKMTLEELHSHLEVEADKYIPFNIKDVILDCQILEEKKEEGKVHVLVVAAKKDAVNHHISILKEAGLDPELLDVDTFAITNAFEHFLGTQSQARFHALLEIGAKMTNISILRGARSLFSRVIPIGGTDFTLAISEKLNLDKDAAEMLKCGGKKSQEELFGLIGSSLENLMGEVKLSFDYFENQYDKRVERIYLSGGSSRLPGLLNYIQKNFNVETLPWDPLEGITIPSDQIRSQLRGIKEGLTVAVGLALRSGT